VKSATKFGLRSAVFEATGKAMNQRLFLVLGAVVASLSLLMFGAACDRHSWEDTRKLHQPHGGHGEHGDHGDHDKAEGDHGAGEKKADH
jgi:hypothetical protein